MQTLFETEHSEAVTDKPFKLTQRQEEALNLFASNAMYLLLYGGSRSTKTFTIIRTIVWRAITVANSRHAVLRFRFNHVKSSIIYDTFPKVMRLCFPDCPYHLDKSDWFVKFPNGSEIWFGGLDDKERTEKILGNEYATIFLNECSQISYNSFLILITRLAQVCNYERDGIKQLRLKMFLDENPPSKGHWTHRLFIDKIEPISKSAVPNPEDYAYMLMNPADNMENLPGSYLEALDRLPKRQRDRFFLGKFADDSENALWTNEIIERSRVSGVPENVRLIRVVVAVDPSGASDDQEEVSDDIGIGVAGLGSDGNAYILEDLTINAGPATWGKVATEAYRRHMADRIVGEKNFGGAMVEYVVKAADPTVCFKAVTASRGKVVRAEPVSALHETGKIKLVGNFPDLEDELCSFTTTGYIGQSSPNRADWFVWAITELFPGLTRQENKQAPKPIPKLKRF